MRPRIRATPPARRARSTRRPGILGPLFEGLGSGIPLSDPSSEQAEIGASLQSVARRLSIPGLSVFESGCRRWPSALQAFSGPARAGLQPERPASLHTTRHERLQSLTSRAFGGFGFGAETYSRGSESQQNPGNPRESSPPEDLDVRIVSARSVAPARASQVCRIVVGRLEPGVDVRGVATYRAADLTYPMNPTCRYNTLRIYTRSNSSFNVASKHVRILCGAHFLSEPLRRWAPAPRLVLEATAARDVGG